MKIRAQILASLYYHGLFAAHITPTYYCRTGAATLDSESIQTLNDFCKRRQSPVSIIRIEISPLKVALGKTYFYLVLVEIA